jgi:diadenylate cyclase
MTGLGRLITYLSWTDLVDILAVSTLIYGLLSLLAGTRAANLLKGIGLVFLVKVLSQAFGLYSVEWLVNMFMTLGVAALVILFQPELRRALEHLGRGALVSVRPRESLVAELVVELQLALERLAATRTGALIVVEQKVGLKDWCQTGVPLDAQITARLLLTVFHEMTPLHDGAIILRSLRIDAASCFLPLSQSLEVASELGSRHRAALGISEVSDAVALVVSEETGHISWCEGGKLERLAPGTHLRSRLSVLLGATSPVAAPELPSFESAASVGITGRPSVP